MKKRQLLSSLCRFFCRYAARRPIISPNMLLKGPLVHAWLFTHYFPFTKLANITRMSVQQTEKFNWIIKAVNGFPRKSAYPLHYNHIVTCQVHPALLKRVQCMVRSFLNFLVVRFSPKDPWPRVLSLPGARVVCWRPHPAGTWQYKGQNSEMLKLIKPPGGCP